MAYFHWVGREAALKSANYTVVVQALNPNDDGQLLWDVFFPKQNVGSVKVSLLTAITQKKYVSDRREWNARGRYIPQEFPGTEELEMVPIEDFFTLGEREIQDLEERFADGAANLTFRQITGVNFDDRVIALARANFRRIELDTFNAWVNGTLTARNPVTGGTYTLSYGIDVTRYQVAAPAWTGAAGGTAYAKFILWLLDAYDRGIQIQGAMMRLSTREAIRTSAPNLAFPLATNIEPTLSDVEKRIQDETGSAFSFYTNERTLDVMTTGGLGTTSTKVWPAQTIAIIPAGEVVGYNGFAPVARAGEVSRAVPEARINRNGMGVFFESMNNGRGLNVECQVNAFPIPDANRVFVINAGI